MKRLRSAWHARRPRPDGRAGPRDTSAHALYALLDAVTAGEGGAGAFHRTRPGVYVGEAHDGVTPILRLQAWEGATYSLSWGVSLAYMPDRLDSDRLRFHRTAKNARLDLYKDGRSVAEREGGSWRDPVVSRLDVEAEVRDALRRAWEWTRPRAQVWWQQAATLDGVLTLARDQAARRPLVLDAIRAPRPDVIAILTLARLGRVSEATAELDRLDDRFDARDRRGIAVAIELAAGRPT